MPPTPRMPKGKIRHKETAKQQEKIKAQMQADHEAYIAKVKADHDEFMANNEAPVFELFQNATEDYLTLDNGAIIAPGYYYVDTGDVQFGLAPTEYERLYEEVK